jgi:predicted AAA+ superfamily ATPase
VAAVVFDHLDEVKGMQARAPDGGLRWLKMPWSLIAWQLAGEAGLKVLNPDGSERTSPPATNVMVEMLELARADIPAVLILFDEVLWFARTMVDVDPARTGRLKAFMHSLTQAVAKVPQCCLVVSLLASDTNKMDAIGKQISKELFDELKRVADEGIQPVERQDVPEILRRRLFTPDSYQNTAAWPAQVIAALNSLETLDPQIKTARNQEEERFPAYPFHPDLLDTLYGKWTMLEGFQQTRGILKTLASALRDAAAWDTQPVIGAQVFLGQPGAAELCPAATSWPTSPRPSSTTAASRTGRRSSARSWRMRATPRKGCRGSMRGRSSRR